MFAYLPSLMHNRQIVKSFGGKIWRDNKWPVFHEFIDQIIIIRCRLLSVYTQLAHAIGEHFQTQRQTIQKPLNHFETYLILDYWTWRSVQQCVTIKIAIFLFGIPVLRKSVSKRLCLYYMNCMASSYFTSLFTITARIHYQRHTDTCDFYYQDWIRPLTFRLSRLHSFSVRRGWCCW